jgi:hypothetical protein
MTGIRFCSMTIVYIFRHKNFRLTLPINPKESDIMIRSTPCLFTHSTKVCLFIILAVLGSEVNHSCVIDPVSPNEFDVLVVMGSVSFVPLPLGPH